MTLTAKILAISVSCVSAVSLAAAVAILVSSSAAQSPLNPASSASQTVENYQRIPTSFEPNLGQADSKYDFLSQGSGHALLLSRGSATLLLQGHSPFPAPSSPGGFRQNPSLNRPGKTTIFRFNLIGTGVHPTPVGLDQLVGKSNYLGGSDTQKWIVDVPHFGRIKYPSAYPGIDVIYYGAPGSGHQLESDYIVAPGADPSVIRIAVDGPEKLAITAAGDLELRAENTEIYLRAPSIYQDGIHGRQKIAGGFHLIGSREFGFEVPEYDRSLPLVIDPVLSYSTYLGGTGNDAAYAVAVDASGNAYLAGETTCCVPATPGAFESTITHNGAGFITKFSPSGSTLIYSTYLYTSVIQAMALDPAGNVYVTGSGGDGFPVTAGAYQTSGAGTVAFVAKLNAAGNALDYGTLLGPTTQIGVFAETTNATAIAIDASGNAYITGSTIAPNFPTTAGAYDRTCGTDGQCNPDNSGNPSLDSFLSKINPTGTSLVYSTFLGGDSDDLGAGISVDSLGNAYVVGSTVSPDFPVTAGAFETLPSAGVDAFVAKLNPTGSALLYSTFLAGNGDDWGYAITLDSGKNAYVAGSTTSTDFPTTPGSYQPAPKVNQLGGNSNAFVTKLNPAGTALVFSTYLGSVDGADQANAIALDSSSNIYVAGITNGDDFPLVTPFQAYCLACPNFDNIFVSELNAAGSSLLFSSYLGGGHSNGDGELASSIAVDKSGNMYVAGSSFYYDFPVINAFQPNMAGPDFNSDAFLTKISPASGDNVYIFPPLTTYGSEPVNGTSRPFGVEVRNIGSTPLSIRNIAITGDFTQTNNCGTDIAAAEYCTVNVSFAPSASGTRNGTLTVTDSAPGSPQSVSFTGTGTIAPLLRLSSYSLGFGNQLVGTTSSPQTETVTNGGSAPLDFSNIIVVQGSFQVANSTCGTSLAVGKSCTLGIAFAPTQSGPASGQLMVGSNDAVTSDVVALSGNGTTVPALLFVPVSPCRVADTRHPTGPFGGPKMTAGSTREFDISQSACDIPSTAAAYSLNVTVVPEATLNYLTLWPSGQSQPNVSTLNSDGRVKANAAIVPAGTNSGVNVFVSDATQLILDIDGYFVPPGTDSGLAFYPVTPCRVADTRNPSGPLGAPFLSAGNSRAFPVRSSNCNLPSSAQAYSLNVTAVPHTTLNYLTTWPTGQAQPYVSTLNSSTGAITANAAIVPAGDAGEVSIYVHDDADVILDVDGYFAPQAAGGLLLNTVMQCRIIDTRPTQFTDSFPVNIQSGFCAQSPLAGAYVLNATALPVSSLNYLTLWADGAAQPYVSTLNAGDGAVTSNMAIVSNSDGTVDAYADGTTNLILDISGYFAPPANAAANRAGETHPATARPARIALAPNR